MTALRKRLFSLLAGLFDLVSLPPSCQDRTSRNKPQIKCQNSDVCTHSLNPL
jgi:hypothetical protein